MTCFLVSSARPLPPPPPPPPPAPPPPPPPPDGDGWGSNDGIHPRKAALRRAGTRTQEALREQEAPRRRRKGPHRRRRRRRRPQIAQRPAICRGGSLRRGASLRRGGSLHRGGSLRLGALERALAARVAAARPAARTLLYAGEIHTPLFPLPICHRTSFPHVSPPRVPPPPPPIFAAHIRVRRWPCRWGGWRHKRRGGASHGKAGGRRRSHVFGSYICGGVCGVGGWDDGRFRSHLVPRGGHPGGGHPGGGYGLLAAV